ncbi:MAG: IS200/IS605 family transposase [Sphingobacteriales bacterium]|nr:IS200/IS605 family transposase [Sphingobacteriales bacterium]
MFHSLPSIWIHAIWSTRDRNPFILPPIEKAVHQFLACKFEETGCPVRIINGMPDHVHCLFRQNPLKSISDVIKQVKGSSSQWINTQGMLPEKFAWQKGYAVYSVGASAMEWIQHYIQEQKIHHLKKTYREEFNHFLRMHGLDNELIA